MTSLFALSVFPSPFEIRPQNEWRDASSGGGAQRTITRIDTSCAAKIVGGLEFFAKDFFIASSHVDKYGYLRMMTFDKIESGEKFTIAEDIDLTVEEKVDLANLLSTKEAICLGGECVQRLSFDVFKDVLNSCGTVVSQREFTSHIFVWRLGDNLEDHYPWSLIALLFSALSFLVSVLYSQTIGRLINWIRTGDWSA
ncbi:hypothetical protein [Guyparkeria sp. SCN-R1]|uniref:hypothetical protein n=1 Tax=Guyparkeria sp. SCN-R1 TaxID=2341113 RepID=UPI000F64E0DF|nr:hypothetical protein [Guyparkeria sp. SCN-R1]